MKTYFLFLIVFFSLNLFAEEELESTLQESTNQTFYLSMGTGLAFISNQFGWSVGFSSYKKIDPDKNLYLGLDFGMNFWSLRNQSLPLLSNIQELRILPSAYYKLNLEKLKNWKPYIGLAIGIGILHGQGLENPNWPSNLKGTLLEVMIKPGIQYELSETLSISIDPHFGWIGGQFMTMPMMNASFLL